MPSPPIEAPSGRYELEPKEMFKKLWESYVGKTSVLSETIFRPFLNDLKSSNPMPRRIQQHICTAKVPDWKDAHTEVIPARVKENKVNCQLLPYVFAFEALMSESERNTMEMANVMMKQRGKSNPNLSVPESTQYSSTVWVYLDHIHPLQKVFEYDQGTGLRWPPNDDTTNHLQHFYDFCKCVGSDDVTSDFYVLQCTACSRPQSTDGVKREFNRYHSLMLYFDMKQRQIYVFNRNGDEYDHTSIGNAIDRIVRCMHQITRKSAWDPSTWSAPFDAEESITDCTGVEYTRLKGRWEHIAVSSNAVGLAGGTCVWASMRHLSAFLTERHLYADGEKFDTLTTQHPTWVEILHGLAYDLAEEDDVEAEWPTWYDDLQCYEKANYLVRCVYTFLRDRTYDEKFDGEASELIQLYRAAEASTLFGDDEDDKSYYVMTKGESVEIINCFGQSDYAGAKVMHCSLQHRYIRYIQSASLVAEGLPLESAASKEAQQRINIYIAQPSWRIAMYDSRQEQMHSILREIRDLASPVRAKVKCSKRATREKINRKLDELEDVRRNLLEEFNKVL